MYHRRAELTTQFEPRPQARPKKALPALRGVDAHSAERRIDAEKPDERRIIPARERAAAQAEKGAEAEKDADLQADASDDAAPSDGEDAE